MHTTGKRWLAAALTGLVSANFSTLAVTLGARRIGRAAKLDWMEVGTVLLRDSGVQVRPGLREIAAGLAVHQSADIFWATTFLAWLDTQPAEQQRRILLAGAVPWAVATSAIEYYALLPWLQPLLTMQVPYWTACSVHLSSAAAYPVFFWLRDQLYGQRSRDQRLAQAVTAGLGAAVVGLAGLAAFVRRRREVPQPLGTDAAQQAQRRFIQHMYWHHVVGQRLAEQVLNRASSAELRMLGRLMLSGHRAELAVLHSWWASWYAEPLPALSADERRSMPGMPPESVVAELEQLVGPEFEQRFLPVMIAHHAGAISMVNALWEQGQDPRVLLFGDSICHAQTGQIARMKALLNQQPLQHQVE